MMEGDPKSAEFRERGSIFKQMAEMKKKIQLVEGERKAIFEDCESEKQENKDKIKALKDEVKVLQVSKAQFCYLLKEHTVPKAHFLFRNSTTMKGNHLRSLRPLGFIEAIFRKSLKYEKSLWTKIFNLEECVVCTKVIWSQIYYGEAI